LEAPFAFQYHTRDHLQGKLKITMEKRQAIARCASGQAIFPFLQYYDFFSFFPSKSQGFSPSLSEYDLSGGVQLPILSVKLDFVCFKYQSIFGSVTMTMGERQPSLSAPF
jgi:hypothetical protein